ncbi:hypothetical protein V8G54_021120 [Vigna mungo]|uniref:ABC transporter domain-containing protein n=1 Tax=Vigna mungo TaxID=3915 RepID=A0AAQ3RX34_VIGMU
MRTTLTGLPLVLQQFRALLKKNLLLSWRNKRATLLQLLSPLIFIFLIFAIDKAIKAQTSTSTAYKTVTDPPTEPSPPITPCEDKFFIKLPCYDFVWSGDQNPIFQTITHPSLQGMPFLFAIFNFIRKLAIDYSPITDSCVQVKSFKNKTEQPYDLSRGASFFVAKRHRYKLRSSDQLHQSSVARQISGPYYVVSTSSSACRRREGNCQTPYWSWNVFLREFAHPSLAPFSAVGSIGPAFFLAIAMFNFVLQISSLVTEKELKLRQSMTMMGLYDFAYWSSWLIWETVVTILSSLLITGLAFMLSAFIKKSSSATTMGFSIFIVGFLTQLVVQAGFPYRDRFSKTLRDLWSLFPPNPFSQGIQVLSDAVATSEDDGVSWSRRGECLHTHADCVITIDDIYKWLAGTFVLWFVLAIYFDNIIPNASGVRKSIFYFLNPNYWIGRGQRVKGSNPRQEISTPDDEDVLDEESKVKQQLTEGLVDANIAVQIHGLVKTYAGTRNIGCCCKCTKTAPYTAVRAKIFSLEVKYQESGQGGKDGLCIVVSMLQLQLQRAPMLRPNGAGKTTAINCLTGITPVTSRDALIYGHSIRSSIGMSNIRKLIGVCPQFDILWDALSGQEHLQLFATIKGLSPASIKSITQTSLAEVKLTDAAKVRAGSHSGGMKRRLSKAEYCLGNVETGRLHRTSVTYILVGMANMITNQLQEREKEFGTSDIQLGLTTLEEVFLNIARQAELENPDLNIWGICAGTESVENPTGFMVEVYWEQDDTGTLCISGHSQKVPIPPGVQLSSSPSARNRRYLSRAGPINGIVIYPSQVSPGDFQR